MTIEIKTAEELFSIGVDAAKPLDGNYRLAGDIDCSSLNSPLPIGNPAGQPFTGILEGDTHTIKNLNIPSPASGDTYNAGLFSILGVGAEVKNLNFDTCSSENNTDNAAASAGLLAGRIVQLDATTQPVKITNCHAINSRVRSTYIAAGLVGKIETSDNSNLLTPLAIIENSSFEGSLRLIKYYAVALGGLVASADRTKFEKSYFIGSIDDNGGLVNGDFGGILGQAHNMVSLLNCFARANFDIDTSYNERIGGLICRNYAAENTSITNCYVANSLARPPHSFDQAGGFIWVFPNVSNPSDYITDCHWDKQSSGLTYDESGVEGQLTSEMQLKKTYQNWDFETIWGILDGATYPDFNLIKEDEGPMLTLEWRNDNQGRWSAPRKISLGKKGDTQLFKNVRQLGSYKSRQYRLTWADEVSIILAVFDEKVTLASEETDGS